MREVPGDPFTIDHFERWCRQLTLDSGDRWRLEPFQLSFIEDVFRGFLEAWLIVPERNGKSTLVAGLALYHMAFTPEAWVPIAASSRDQARIIDKQAKGFITRGDGLAGFRAFDGYRRIDLRATGGQIEVFAADDRTGDGVIPTLCILDELHRHRSLDLYETWRGKLEKRGGQLVTISTADEPGSWWISHPSGSARATPRRRGDGCTRTAPAEIDLAVPRRGLRPSEDEAVAAPRTLLEHRDEGVYAASTGHGPSPSWSPGFPRGSAASGRRTPRRDRSDRTVR